LIDVLIEEAEILENGGTLEIRSRLGISGDEYRVLDEHGIERTVWRRGRGHTGPEAR
jgi:hypothetical protein